MATLTQVSDSLELAKAYYSILISEYITKLKSGRCVDNLKSIICLRRLIRAIGWDVEIEEVDDTTVILYGMLLKAIAPYTGSTLPVNPNAYIPGVTIIVEQNYVTPVKVFFTDETSPEITTWQASYADTFGNNPTLAIYLSNGSNSYSELTGVTPTLQFDGSNQLLSITYDIGVASTGYILIST